MADCKYCKDEVCVNADCPMCCDFCPVVDVPGVCRFLEALDIAIAALREQEGKDTNAPTNADRIRAMSDEELADLLNQWGTSTRAWQKDPGETLYWLQQPAGEEDKYENHT